MVGGYENDSLDNDHSPSLSHCVCVCGAIWVPKLDSPKGFLGLYPRHKVTAS